MNMTIFKYLNSKPQIDLNDIFLSHKYWIY